MLSPVSARTALRRGTADHHDQVDAIFSRVDLGDRASYGRFLQAQAAAYLPVEAALTRDGAGMVLGDWPQRQRGDLLGGDLAALGIAPPPAAGTIGFASPAAILGGVYVLEGSRLGGTMLARSVPADFPRRFLDAASPTAWRSLIVLLEEQLSSPSDRQIAINAACEVFLLFERAGAEFLKVPQLVG